MNKTKILNLGLAINACIFTGGSFKSHSSDYIQPAMINIPAGTTSIGSLLKDKRVNPVKSIKLPDFQMGKYPVTVAEYRLFIADSKYVPTQTCYDGISANWFGGANSKGAATWDKHRFLDSEYQPVTCIDYKDMLAYADWISLKTGVKYRLPNEHEWVYAEKGNKNGKFFWGDDLSKKDACLYGNFADKSGEYHASQDYGASYSGFINIVDCDDGEPYNSIVGLYRPNPFGLFDMVGNVNQYLTSCYFDDLEPRSEEETDVNQCEFVVHRAENWHFPATAHTSRSRVKRVGDNSWALVGFRLATNGHSHEEAPTTKTFELELKKAQEKRLQERVRLLEEPKNVYLGKIADDQYQLNWQPSKDIRVTHYDIYQSKSVNSHQRKGYYQNYYEKIETVSAKHNFVNIKLPDQGASYRVVSVGADISSLPSEVVIKVPTLVNNLPGKLWVKNNNGLDNVSLSLRKETTDKPELYYLSKFNPGHEPLSTKVNFKINVQNTGWYTVNYYGRSVIQGEMLKMWLGNRYLGSLNFNENIDDRTSNRHKVYLEKGLHNFQLSTVKEGFDYWSFAWLEFKELES